MFSSRIVQLICVLALAWMISGCGSFGRSLKNMVGGKPESKQGIPSPNGTAATPAATPATSYGAGPSFLSTPNYMSSDSRHYRRVTKDNFAENQQLDESAGSLWKKEGQGSYLFSQNNLRVMGDIVNVEIGGKVAENLTERIQGLKKNYARFEMPLQPPPRPIFRNKMADDNNPVGKIPKPDDKNGVASTTATPDYEANRNVASAPAPAAEVAANGDKKDQEQKFDSVPCRIIEKNADGSYRVKGQQTIYVSNREYRVIVTGIVRADDISTDVVSAQKLLDSKVDLVATNKDVRNDTQTR